MQSLNQNRENQSVEQAQGSKRLFFGAAMRAVVQRVHAHCLAALFKIASAEVVMHLSGRIQLKEQLVRIRPRWPECLRLGIKGIVGTARSCDDLETATVAACNGEISGPAMPARIARTERQRPSSRDSILAGRSAFRIDANPDRAWGPCQQVQLVRQQR